VRLAGISVAACCETEKTSSLSDRLERRDHLAEGETISRAGQAKAAERPALREEHSRAGQRVQSFGEVVPGAADFRRDVVDAHRAIVAVSGNAQDGVYRLLGSAGEPHEKAAGTIILANIM
jgi:hypothetical protein